MNEQIKEASHKILDVLGIPRAGYKIDLVTVELTALLEAERKTIIDAITNGDYCRMADHMQDYCDCAGIRRDFLQENTQ